MPQFRYRAVTPAGEFVVGEIEAPSRQEVLRRIEYVGQIALEAALQTLGNDAGRGLARFVKTLRESISAGEGFADALERHPSIMEPAYVAMVRAGEASGDLESVLRAIVEDRTRRQLLAERVGSAVRYPCFLIGTATVILGFFLMYVVPQFEPIFKDLGGRLNSGAAFVVTASPWLRGNVDLLLGPVIGLGLGTWLVLKQPRLRGAILAALATLPGVAGLLSDRRAARLVGTLGLLVENGVALPAALKILRDIVTEPRYAEAAQRVHEQV